MNWLYGKLLFLWWVDNFQVRKIHEIFPHRAYKRDIPIFYVYFKMNCRKIVDISKWWVILTYSTRSRKLTSFKRWFDSYSYSSWRLSSDKLDITSIKRNNVEYSSSSLLIFHVLVEKKHFVNSLYSQIKIGHKWYFKHLWIYLSAFS